LNIGPSPEGEFDDTAYNRLKEIGEWIRVNGEAIYNTRMYSSYKDGESVRFTQSKDGKTKYIFMFDFPENNVQITKISILKTSKLQLLGSNKKISWKVNDKGVEIFIPKELKKVTNHVWVIKIKD